MSLSIRVFLTAAALVSTAAHAATHYRIVDTGISNANAVQVQGMNEKGDLVGLAYNASFEAEAFVYDRSSGSVTALPAVGPGLSFTGSQAFAINERGTIVGLTSVPGMNEWHGVLWNKSGGYQLLGIHYANGIDRRGRIVGQSEDSRAIMWVRGNIIDLGIPQSAIARTLTERGFISGVLQDSGHGFVYHDGEAEDVGVLYPGSLSDAVKVNNFGEAVGIAGVAPVPGGFGGGYIYPQHAFLYRHGEMKDLGTLSDDPTLSSFGMSINDSREVVGGSQISPGPDGGPVQSIAFLYEHGKMRDLNSLVDPADPLASQVTLNRATDISCRGWIAAEGTNNASGTFGAYLLIPEHPRRPPHVCIKR